MDANHTSNGEEGLQTDHLSYHSPLRWFTSKCFCCPLELKDLIEYGDVGGVLRILRSTPALANQDIGGDWTPMQWAAFTGKIEVVKVLQEFGSDVNGADHVG
eukprot:c12230_g1_i2.p1 GENE.c12230_g1_i2~~c12230_g1_i2.p1  ORF type:complete len:110 (-),score=20.42 c12230_g1_i2:282-587(-)